MVDKGRKPLADWAEAEVRAALALPRRAPGIAALILLIALGYAYWKWGEQKKDKGSPIVGRDIHIETKIDTSIGTVDASSSSTAITDNSVNTRNTYMEVSKSTSAASSDQERGEEAVGAEKSPNSNSQPPTSTYRGSSVVRETQSPLQIKISTALFQALDSLSDTKENWPYRRIPPSNGV